MNPRVALVACNATLSAAWSDSFPSCEIWREPFHIKAQVRADLGHTDTEDTVSKFVGDMLHLRESPSLEDVYAWSEAMGIAWGESHPGYLKYLRGIWIEFHSLSEWVPCLANVEKSDLGIGSGKYPQTIPLSLPSSLSLSLSFFHLSSAID